MEMSSEAAVIQLWSSEGEDSLNTRLVITEVVGVDQNPQERKHRKGRVLDQTLK